MESRSNQEEILRIAKDLIKIRTEPTSFHEFRIVLEYIKKYLKDTDYFIMEKVTSGYPALFISKKTNPSILLCGHVDVVPAGGNPVTGIYMSIYTIPQNFLK